MQLRLKATLAQVFAKKKTVEGVKSRNATRTKFQSEGGKKFISITKVAFPPNYSYFQLWNAGPAKFLAIFTIFSQEKSKECVGLGRRIHFCSTAKEEKRRTKTFKSQQAKTGFTYARSSRFHAFSKCRRTRAFELPGEPKKSLHFLI